MLLASVLSWRRPGSASKVEERSGVFMVMKRKGNKITVSREREFKSSLLRTLHINKQRD